MKNITKSPLTPSRKTFQKGGKWIERSHSEIMVCACGNKYIKTRTGQSSCVRCIGRIVVDISKK